jgi:hypothetical protein
MPDEKDKQREQPQQGRLTQGPSAPETPIHHLEGASLTTQQESPDYHELKAIGLGPQPAPGRRRKFTRQQVKDLRIKLKAAVEGSSDRWSVAAMKELARRFLPENHKVSNKVLEREVVAPVRRELKIARNISGEK